MKHHLTPLTMAMIWKNKNITNVGKDVEKRKHFYPDGRNVNWYSHLENSVEVPLKVENRTTMRSSDLTSGYTAKNKIKSQSQRKICTPMFIIALCTIAKVWKKSKCPSTNAWLKKMWYIYKMEYHPVFKKKERLSFEIWMSLKDIIWCEINQTQEKQISHDLTYVWNIKVNFLVTE